MKPNSVAPLSSVSKPKVRPALVTLGAAQGVVAGVVSALAIGTIAVLVHRVRRLPSSEMAFARAIVGFVVLGWAARKEWRHLASPGASTVAVVALGGAGSILCFFWNLQHASIGTANAFLNLSPAFVVVLCFWPLRDRPGAWEALGVILMVAGALWIHIPRSSTPPPTVTAIGLAGALCAAAAFLSMGKASARFSASLIVATLCIAIAVASLVAGVANWKEPTAGEFAVLLAIGACGIVGHWLMTRSFALLPPVLASGLTLTAMVWSICIGAVLGELPERSEWVAYLLVLAGAVLSNTGWRSRVAQSRSKEAES